MNDNKLSSYYESQARIGVEAILNYIGEDIKRNGLIDTPARVVKAFYEQTSGYRLEPADVLTTQFEENSDEMIVLRNIEFQSLCEHHLLPFFGFATIGYIPQKGKVVGISKLARLVDLFAKRLQIQERMTRQIADAIEEHLEALGVGVIISAKHQCMSCRGVAKQQSEMVTSVMLGLMKEDDKARAEFLRFLN